MVSEKGLESINMREVAKACEVAIGSIYNYFPSKSELLVATIESVWEDIFDFENTTHCFITYVEQFFSHICKKIAKYPHFFTIHSLNFSSNGQKDAKMAMEKYLVKIRKKMLENLKSDEQIDASKFDDTFNEEKFVMFVLTNIVSLLVQKQYHCDVLLEVIKRTLY